MPLLYGRTVQRSSDYIKLMQALSQAAGSTFTSEADFTGALCDAWLRYREGQQPPLVIVVHVHAGEKLRSRFTSLWSMLRAHPLYLRDADCDFDPQYADIDFEAPTDVVVAIARYVATASSEEVQRLAHPPTQAARWRDGLRVAEARVAQHAAALPEEQLIAALRREAMHGTSEEEDAIQRIVGDLRDGVVAPTRRGEAN